MAIRPVFKILNKPPYFEEINVEFTYFSGFAITQRQKSIRSLHSEYLEMYPQSSVLEISTQSENDLGKKLSAFNLSIEIGSKGFFSVESIFQSCKVFIDGGPYHNILMMSSREAKKVIKEKSESRLLKFDFFGREFPLQPRTFFYDWLYVNALNKNFVLHKELMEYDSFTDIVFNPNKSINCQARSVAIFCSLKKNRILESALRSKEDFLKVVYNQKDTVYENVFFKEDNLFE